MEGGVIKSSNIRQNISILGITLTDDRKEQKDVQTKKEREREEGRDRESVNTALIDAVKLRLLWYRYMRQMDSYSL